jgi:hypothetical protein
MSRKHFIAAAREISYMPIMSERLAAAIVFCKVAKQFNSQFDQARFLTACEV